MLEHLSNAGHFADIAALSSSIDNRWIIKRDALPKHAQLDLIVIGRKQLPRNRQALPCRRLRRDGVTPVGRRASIGQEQETPKTCLKF